MNVLIAVDETQFADCIADFVTSHEWPPHTNFSVLHVVEPITPIAATLPGPVVEMIAEDRKKYGENVTHRLVMRIVDAFKTEHVQEAVVEGHPKDTIIEWAEKVGADVIVVGAHSKSLLERLMLGSVSLAVVTRAQCSVAVVRPAIRHTHSADSSSTEKNKVGEKLAAL